MIGIWNEAGVHARFRLFAAFAAACWFAGILPAQAPDAAAPLSPASVAPSDAAVARLSLREAVILGLVEGITEFLPISSTGHLIIANNMLGLDVDTPLSDAQGAPLYAEAPSPENPAGVPLTIKLAADTYAVVIQVGGIAAVLILYAGQLFGIVRGLAGQNAAGLRLLRNIVLAVFPAAAIGLLLHEWIEDRLFSIEAVIVALLSGAVLMVAAERWRKDQPAARGKAEPSDLSSRQALAVGLMQCFALWPGMSRSMMTMVGGYFVGLTPAKAAEFSFLVGLPTLAGAALLKAYGNGAAMITVFGWTPVLVGALVAALSAGLAVRFLVRYLTRHGLAVFAVYRVVLAALLAAWFFA